MTDRAGNCLGVSIDAATANQLPDTIHDLVQTKPAFACFCRQVDRVVTNAQWHWDIELGSIGPEVETRARNQTGSWWGERHWLYRQRHWFVDGVGGELQDHATIGAGYRPAGLVRCGGGGKDDWASDERADARAQNIERGGGSDDP